MGMGLHLADLLGDGARLQTTSQSFWSRTLFYRHKLYRAYPKNKDDVAFLGDILKAGEDGVRPSRNENLAILDYCAANNAIKPDTI